MSIDQLMQSPTFTYFVILILSIVIFKKVFVPEQKIPPLKAAVAYIMLAFGALMLNFFQLQAGLPIIPSLLVAVAMMGIVWLRQKFGNSTSKEDSDRNVS